MPEPMLLRLSRITRVDLVDKGASYDPLTGEGAHILIHKRAPDAVTKKVEQRGEKWVVLDADGEKVLGTHDSEAEAKAQLAAIESKKSEKRAPWWSRAAGVLKTLGIVKDEYGMEPARTFEEAFLARTMYSVTNCLSDAYGALYEAIEGAIRSADDKPAAIGAAVSSFQRTIEAKVQEWLDGPVADGGVEKIAGARLSRMKAAHDMIGVAIREAEGGETMAEKKATLDLSALAEPVRKAIEAHIAGLTTERDTAVAKLADVEKAAGKPKDPWEGVSADVRKRMEDQDAEIKKLRDQADQTVFVAKASAYKGLPIKADDDWRVFQAIDGLGAVVSKRVHELLAAGDAAMKAAVGRPIGSDMPGSVGGDAWAKIEAGAADLVSKSAGKVSKDAGVSEYLRTPEGRTLYEEYLNQNPQQKKAGA